MCDGKWRLSLLPWVFQPHSWVFGSQSAGPSCDVQPDPAGSPAQPPAPCCPPETPAAPPGPPGSCGRTQENASERESRQKEVRCGSLLGEFNNCPNILFFSISISSFYCSNDPVTQPGYSQLVSEVMCRKFTVLTFVLFIFVCLYSVFSQWTASGWRDSNVGICWYKHRLLHRGQLCSP